MDSILEEPKIFVPLIGTLLKALGGKFRISQDDLNDVAGDALVDEYDPVSRTLTLRLIPKEHRDAPLS